MPAPSGQIPPPWGGGRTRPPPRGLLASRARVFTTCLKIIDEEWAAVEDLVDIRDGWARADRILAAHPRL
jgi:hypothetical protein